MQIDWAAVIRGALKGERAHVLEVVGQALGEYGDGLLGDVETMIAQAADQVRAELRVEFARQLDGLRGQIHTQGNELRAELEKIIAKKARARTKGAKPNGERLLLPAPNGNGDAHGPQ
jgi:hypothetical protein